MPASPRFFCRSCGSHDVSATKPAFFDLNDGDSTTPVDIDWEAEWQYAYCDSCGESDYYDDMIGDKDDGELFTEEAA